MGEEDIKDKEALAISVAPILDNTVEYFTSRRIELSITNLLPSAVVLEDISLCFQPDGGGADIYADARLDVPVPKNEVAAVSVDVRPTTEFMEYTNYFNVLLHYRMGDRLEQRLMVRRDYASYLIIKRPDDHVGSVFVSFKQLEDISLARLLELHLSRAGLDPYIVLDEPEPGRRQWARIEDAIRKSRAAFVIWGSRTEWGTGVQREIDLCRRHGVEEILLLDQRLEVPELYAGTQNEYLRFDPENPRQAFAKAVEATRRRFIKGME